MNTLILTGGGTAGHVVPLVAVYPFVKKNFDKIYYIGSGKQMEVDLVNPLGIPIFAIKSPKFRRAISLKNLALPAQLAKSVSDAKKLLLKLQPSVVFSKGGYCALPVCIAARSLKVPVVCHESDLSLGLANRVTLAFGGKLVTTFRKTADKHNGVCVGPPMRKDLFSVKKSRARDHFNLSGKKPVLLVMGGSQGSKAINQAVDENLDSLLKSFDIIHLRGKGNKWGNRSIKGYLPYEFYSMEYCLAAADFAISRGGSNSLFELLAFKIPTAVVPLKKGSRGDQVKNADYFAAKGAVLSFDEDYFSLNVTDIAMKLKVQEQKIKNAIDKLQIENGSKKIAQNLLECIKA